ncbi:unnamed protein product [Thlaspi arvense]|uniref:Uncharacterized protein n=1 Tax=Thlaspi arvense TaxID=13288 RepID=A0AAU9RDU5_THLAR|nr:unnamed protein product [Thlaspi arvense]
MKMVLQGLFLVAIFFNLAYTQLVKGQLGKDCQTRCGNVTIHYPFGTSPGCYFGDDSSFRLTCNDVQGKLLFRGKMQVINISRSGELRIRNRIAHSCSYRNNFTHSLESFESLDNEIHLGNLSLSDKNCRFTSVGCNTYAYMTTISDDRNYTTGCLSVCDSPPVANGSCSGEGCCHTPVPKESNHLIISSGRFDHQMSVNNSNPCDYAFLVEDGMYNFSSTEDLKNLRNIREFPVVLDWSIGDQSCKQAGNTSICGGNTTCFDSPRGKGYYCNCTQGYEGNPYRPYGCQDIDECTHTIHKHNCSDRSICENKLGSFSCKCLSSRYHLNHTDNRCMRTPKPKYLEWTEIFLGTTIFFLVILLAVTCVQLWIKNRKDTELRQQFFEQNGGGMLMQRLSEAGPSNADVKIFTEEGMMEATNDYDERRILGQGGQGTVYKGTMPDGSTVAIKKARLGDNSQVEQFINEVVVLSQINHRNVVKLLGCCLETEVPLLVYEYIASGTLFDHLHGSLADASLTWEHRLRIAIEVAGALAYLHSSASIPIIHRDVKTANILLDENLTAKVADFGASRLIPMDKEQLTTIVLGTMGYLDPEYHNTGLLNEKSDVFSFGVVLMELLSGQQALSFERPQQSKHLAMYFASAMKEQRLDEVIDGQLWNEGTQREIQEAARIAIECTRMTGQERPKMRQVAAELEALVVTEAKHPWSDPYPEPMEIEHLIGVGTFTEQGETSGTSASRTSLW